MATAQVIDVIFRGRNDADAAIRGVEQGLANVDKAGEGIGRAGEAVDGMTSRLNVLGPLLATVFAGVSIKALYDGFVSANIEVEKFTLAMTQISGNGAAAGRDLDYLRNVSDRLGLSVKDTAGSYVSLMAAAKGTALEGNETRLLFEAVSSAMGKLGKSSADTQGALLALQQAMSKGTVQAEEIRGQLAERLPGAFQIAARAVGATTAEFGKMLEGGKVIAEDFIPKFRAELNRTFGDPGQIDTYTAAVNRMGNAWEKALQDIGAASGGLSTFVQNLATKEIEKFGSNSEAAVLRFRAFVDLLRGGSIETYQVQLGLIEQKQRGFNAALDDGNQTLAETARLQRQNADAAERTATSYDQVETAKFVRQGESAARALKEVNDAFATLGLQPDKINNNFDKITAAFKTLADDPNINGEFLVKGLDSAISKVRDSKSLQTLRVEFAEAFGAGRISVDQLHAGLTSLNKAQEDLDKAAGRNVKSLENQSKETARAKESAEKLYLEMEKLASNERIKALEFRANLNIENVKANAAIMQKAFESLDNTVNSTADVITKAFGLLGGGGDLLDSSVRNKLFEQVDRENVNRENALATQRELTQAQIKVLEAQARQINGGDALIKVDGSGLKPHLEAIMWELLKAIQVRTNKDGLKLLLGVS
jgi:tape measure domain-containing protein